MQCYLQSKLLENNKEVTRSSTLNTETTSTGIVKTWRTDYYYLGLLTLLVIELIKNFRSAAMVSSTSLSKRNFLEFLNVLKKLWSTSWESQRSTVLCHLSEEKFANGFQASLMLALTEYLMVSLSMYKAQEGFNLFSKIKMSCTHLFLNFPKECAP